MSVSVYLTLAPSPDTRDVNDAVIGQARAAGAWGLITRGLYQLTADRLWLPGGWFTLDHLWALPRGSYAVMFHMTGWPPRAVAYLVRG